MRTALIGILVFTPWSFVAAGMLGIFSRKWWREKREKRRALWDRAAINGLVTAAEQAVACGISGNNFSWLELRYKATDADIRYRNAFGEFPAERLEDRVDRLIKKVHPTYRPTHRSAS